ncbi:MAG: quinohemoprotein amine dehydrogenase subunit gamma [Acidobacteriia bacterium]|nr:quinohemoprotein amine dehydrogenase subunit gamma [Terriglobia bacterium]
MKYLRAANRKARRLVSDGQRTQAGTPAPISGTPSDAGDVIALQEQAPARPHIPMGCSLSFSPGWEVDSAGGTAGLCQPVERDIYDCYNSCFWPAQVPDHVNNYPDWASKCAVATKDWRNLDLVFP